jgi:hypothetical protein
MNPKEKANDLFTTFRYALSHKDAPFGMYKDNMAIQCALIAVEEMIIQNGELYLLGLAKEYYIEKNAYLFNVKSELKSFQKTLNL